MSNRERCTAVVLAAGSGSRMHSEVAKQFMMLNGKPLIYYALRAMEESQIIDDCILVTGKEDIERIRTEIVEQYGFRKVDRIIAGGEERYASVANAMRVIRDDGLTIPNRNGYVFVQDGARPFLSEEILLRTYEAVKHYGACVAAVPSKDTVKIADEEDFAKFTPARKTVWCIQTPQVFETGLITMTYERLEQELPRLKAEGILVSDDASVVELFSDKKVKLVEGSYQNIKITTPEDMKIAEAFLAE